MVEEIQSGEAHTWEDLRRKTQERRQGAASNKTVRTVLIVIVAGILSILGIVAAFSAEEATEPLVLPESVTVRPLMLADSVLPEASEFVQGLSGTDIQVSFAKEMDEKQLGSQSVTLMFARGREVCTREATLYRFHLETAVTVKSEEAGGVNIRNFVPDETVSAAFAVPPQADACGVINLLVRCDTMEYPVTLTVTEENPPTGVGLELQVAAGTVPEPGDFVGDITDQSKVTVTYQETPVFVQAGQQSVVLVLTDEFGNTAQVTATAVVTPNPDGPQFTGLDPLYIQLGGTVSYKADVSAQDAQDGKLTFTVDTGDFDSKTAGTYTVYYSATDADGNTLTVPRMIVVESHTGQLVRESARKVLDEIIEPTMTRDQKIQAVFSKVRNFVWYSGSSDKSSLENAAYEGFTKWTGDCYTYYAMVKVMLDTLEIENLEVARTGGTSRHWWSLVLFEDGKYYHVDASPQRYKVDGIQQGKMTEGDLATYTNDAKIAKHRPSYYVYDRTLPEYQDIEIAQ